MTEDEAKKKKCPLLFMGNLAVMLVTDQRTRVESDCVGSACAMWREYGPFSPDYKPRPYEIGGYCGLAGTP